MGPEGVHDSSEQRTPGPEVVSMPVRNIDTFWPGAPTLGVTPLASCYFILSISIFPYYLFI